MDNTIKCIKVSCINCKNRVTKNFVERCNLIEIDQSHFMIKSIFLYCINYSDKIDYNNNYLSEKIKCAYCNKTLGVNVVSATEFHLNLIDHIILHSNKVLM